MVVRRRPNKIHKRVTRRRVTRRRVTRRRMANRRVTRRRSGGQSINEMHAERNRLQTHIHDVLNGDMEPEEKRNEIASLEHRARQINAFFRARGENEYADTEEHLHNALDEVDATNNNDNNDNDDETIVMNSYKYNNNNNNNNNSNMSMY